MGLPLLIPRRSKVVLSALAFLSACIGGAAAAPSQNEICALIARSAEENGLPKSFFARLIWTESRFDHRALSPMGAQGIAQFMPATAKAEGLADPYDVAQAIPASAALLARLARGYGNLGLAAAAYNAGEGRVDAWLYRDGYLPLETENYVLTITGEAAEDFIGRTGPLPERPVGTSGDFIADCMAMPVMMTRSPSMAEIIRKPWFVQVGGGFRRSAVAASWARLKPKVAAAVADNPVAISRVRSTRGRGALHVVRIGTDSRDEGERLCGAVRRAGGGCIVLKTK